MEKQSPLASQDTDLPYNLDAERALLGGMILNPNSIGDIAEIIKPEDFYFLPHKIIFDTIRRIYDDNRMIDPIILSEELRKAGSLDDAGGEEYIDNLPMDASSMMLMENHARLVRDKAVLRRLIETTRKISDLAMKAREDVEEIIDKAEEHIFSLSQSLHTGEAQKLGEILHEVYAKIERIREKDSRISGIPTGFEDLDNLTSGLHPGELVIIAGRPSMGKTSFANNIVDRVGVRMGRPTGLFSLEVTKEQVVQNLLCIHGLIDAQRLRRGMLNSEEMEKLRGAAALLYEAPVYIDDTQGLTTLALRHKARRLVKNFGVELVIVDYLQLMETEFSKRSETRQQEISRISRSLKGLARELEIPVVALSQLNRSVEQRDDHRPRMSDLRESGAIEQDADVVIMLHREEYYLTNPGPDVKGRAEIIVAKQRNGPTGSLKLFFNSKCMRFDTLGRT